MAGWSSLHDVLDEPLRDWRGHSIVRDALVDEPWCADGWRQLGFPRRVQALMQEQGCTFVRHVEPAWHDLPRRDDATRALSELCPWARIAIAEPDVLRGWKDELLRLLFACCHPALEEGESAALALATVVGLSTDEIAQAFVAAPRSMEQRLTRARQRLREKGDVEGTTPERGDDQTRLRAGAR